MADFCQFFPVLCSDVLISWHCDVNCEADPFLVVDQRDVRLIVKQTFVSLNKGSQRVLA